MKGRHFGAAAIGLVLLGVDTSAEPVAGTRQEVSIWALPDPKGERRKYELEGPFAIGDPVHETLTVTALVRAGLATKSTGKRDALLAQYLRGVFWNDDPCAQLFRGSVRNPLRASFGYDWYFDFRAARATTTGDFSALECPLLGESHFGRLQFLHAMAHAASIEAQVTLEQVVGWASVAYRLSTGVLDAKQPLSMDPVAGKLLGDKAALSAAQLFVGATPAETRERALGSLLHLLQDSFARGHVERDQSGAIVRFLSYRGQDTAKHSHDDAWGTGDTDAARIVATPGAALAIDASAEVVSMHMRGASWSDVENYLRRGPLRMAPETKPSGTGAFAGPTRP
jgi:hypothetical protein